MHARLSRFAGLTPERLQAAIDQFRDEALPFFEQQPGYEGMLLLANRNAGTAAGVSFWSTERDMDRSEKLADQSRKAAMATGAPAQEPLVDRYEVILNTMQALGQATTTA
jgi:heme-degrading monooxygenase HmoA